MTKVTITLGDITGIKADAVVNAANRTLLGGGGVDAAIHRKAGPGLLEECRQLGGCLTGRAKITKGYGLPAKYVIHTVGPVWSGGANHEADLLADCYRNCLALALDNDLKTIAFPSISTGAYRFPIISAASIALSAVREFILENPSSLQEVIFVLFSQEDLDIYRENYNKIFA